MNFDYCLSVKDIPQPLGRERFEQLVRVPWLKELADKIAAGDLEAKRRLPAATWQASYGGYRRADENAVPSGLFALDVDHIEDPRALFDSFAERIEELGIYIVHKTPSCKGLRVVAACRKEFATIMEHQAWLAKEIGVEHDACTKDWARLSFLVPEDYFYYYNPKVFSDDPQALLNKDASAETVSMSEPATQKSSTEHTSGDQVQTESSSIVPESGLEYHGVPYSKIVREVVYRLGGSPKPGDRNKMLYKVCRMLADITDRDPDMLFSVCPRFGLPEGEVRSVSLSACKSNRTERMPYLLYKVLRDLQIIDAYGNYRDSQQAAKGLGSSEDEDDDIDDDEQADTEGPNPTDMPRVDHLPPLIRQFVETAPDDFKVATAMCCLPVCGFLASRVRAQYLDGEVQAPSFIVNIMAPAASGKGQLLRVPNKCLKRVREMDDEGRHQEDEYLKLKELNKNAKKQVPEPQPIVRDVPAKISVAQLLKRMVQARGLHLISISAEADTLVATNKSGMWAQKTDIYRIAMDGTGGRYGQDYFSTASFSATVNMRYNLLTLGTPGAMSRLFPDIEDGLVTRCIMVELPDQFGKDMPMVKEFTTKQMQVIEEKIEALMAYSQDSKGLVKPETYLNLSWLNEALAEWQRKQLRLCVRNDDHARDAFRRRSGLVGFRAGMVAAVLWGKSLDARRKRFAAEFAIWVAECMLAQFIARYGEKATEEAMKYAAPKAKNYPSIFDAVGDVFSLDDLKKACKAQKVRTKARTVAWRWAENGLIEKQSRGNWIKLVK